VGLGFIALNACVFNWEMFLYSFWIVLVFLDEQKKKRRLQKKSYFESLKHILEFSWKGMHFDEPEEQEQQVPKLQLLLLHKNKCSFLALPLTDDNETCL
jgi:hypothetical protein